MATITRSGPSLDAARPVLTRPASRALAALRLVTGFIFLWAFIDKTFGLGFATPTERAWINGGTPAQGFLKSLEEGPFFNLFNSIATPAADVLFMLCMLGVGVAVMLGIGLRVSAVAGSLMMLFMWLAEFPLTMTGSNNPLVDYHIVYGLALVVAALTFAGDTWGLGKTWASLPLVQKNTWLR